MYFDLRNTMIKVYNNNGDQDNGRPIEPCSVLSRKSIIYSLSTKTTLKRYIVMQEKNTVRFCSRSQTFTVPHRKLRSG